MKSLSYIISCLLLAGCVHAVDGDPVVVETGSNAPSDDGKGDVYGEDDRKELYSANVSAAHRRTAEATAVLVGPGGFFDQNDNEATLLNQSLANKIHRDAGGPACSTERYLDQPAPGFCSGFLIAPDLVATAGHCINFATAVHRASYVFGFAYESDGDAGVRTIPAEDVYQSQTVVGHVFNQGEVSTADLINREYWEDWAIVKLDRPVTNRRPIDIRDLALAAGERVAAIGHPMGVPTKVTAGEVFDASHRHYVNTDLDIYQGNSGSVVADESGAAVGIVIRGSGGNSYVETANGCFMSRECDGIDTSAGSKCVGNHVMRADALKAFVDPSLRQEITNQVPPTQALIPDGSTRGVSLTQQIATSGAIAYLTVNANVSHYDPADLEFHLEHNGRSVAIAQNPTVWSGGEFRFSRTTRDFDGLDAQGSWTLRVVDTKTSGAGSQSVSWWQIVVGLKSGATLPTSTSFVGTPCQSDNDCAFDAQGSPGFCYDFETTSGTHGFCSVPCEGFCPDRAGFATTFCIASDSSTVGVCAAREDALNGFCSEIDGTQARLTDRFVGSSSATPSSQSVCAPSTF